MSLVSKVSNLKPMRNLYNSFRKDPVKTTAAAAITSIAVKDGVGCVMYVTQSLNNKKIPDDKRLGVAALDLTNGILMVAVQVGMFFAMRSINKKAFNKCFNSSFSKNAKKTIATKWRMMQKKAGKTPSRKQDIYKEINKYEKSAFNIFSFVSELAAATIVGKRMLVPFLATPLADVLEKKWGLGDIKKGGNPDATKAQEPNFEANITETNLIERYKKENNIV